MDESNPRLKKIILEVVSNQIRQSDPPETKVTLDRLISEGYSEEESREMIGAVVSSHIYEIMKEQKEFDTTSYVNDLNKLPKLPWE